MNAFFPTNYAFKIFLISFMVFFKVSCSTMSIFVMTIKKGISRARAIPRCSLVIFVRPLLAPITIRVYSGTIPTIPTMVVFKYFSWPHRSIKLTIFLAHGTISVQYLFFLCTNHSAKICSFFSSKTMIS